MTLFLQVTQELRVTLGLWDLLVHQENEAAREREENE
jgi:hypothetical protein